MKIILLEDVPQFGKRGDVKEASPGYARNFLFPKSLAKPATEKALMALRSTEEFEHKKRAEEIERLQALRDSIVKLRLVIKTKAGESGKTFGAITAAKIGDALKKKNIGVKKEWLALEGPIKTTGEHKIKIKFPHGIEGWFTIIIEPE